MKAESQKNIRKEADISIVHMILLLLVFSSFFGLSFLIQQRNTDNIPVDCYMQSDVTYSDGTSKHTDSNYFGNVSKGDQVTVHLTLPKSLEKSDQALCFGIYHSVTEIWFGDTLLCKKGESQAKAGDMIGYISYQVPIPQEAWGQEITIRLTPTENNAFARIYSPKLYPTTETYHFFVDEQPLRFLLALPLLLISALFLLLVLLLKQDFDLKVKGVGFSTCLLILSMYLFATSGQPYVMFPDTTIWSYMEFISAIVVSYPLLLYVALSLSKGGKKQFCFSVFGLDLLFFLVTTILHCTNQIHYCEVLISAHLLTGLNAFIVLAYSIRGHREDNVPRAIRYDSFILAALCGIVEVSRNTLMNFMGISIPSVLDFGLVSLVVGMILSYLVEMSSQLTKVLIEQLKTQKLQQTLNQIPAGICVVDLTSNIRIQQANPAFYHVGGYDKSHSLNGVSLFDFVYEPDRGKILNLWQNVLSGDDTVPEVETKICKKDGQLRDILAKTYVNREEMTATINLLDITERKQMEDDLRISEMRYRLALTQSGKVFFFLDVPDRTIHLSDELAQIFGLPNVVDNMPENFIAHGLVEEGSVDAYCRFYEWIYRGDEYGETVISCHMKSKPEDILWYRIAFTSVFDKQGIPQSAVITYEDLSEQRKNEISNAWKQQNLVAISEHDWSVTENNLTHNRQISRRGTLLCNIPEEMTAYDAILRYVSEHVVASEDQERYRRFLDRERILQLYQEGITEDVLEYGVMRNEDEVRWMRGNLQLIQDPYSRDVLSQWLVQDIHREKTGQLQMQRSMEELKQELENSRIRIMINQMQSHFLYNALSAIQTIVKIDPDYAYQLIYDFTVHLRASIRSLSSDKPIPFKEELKNIKAYLNIEQMRFGDLLKIQYEIRCEDFMVIPLSIQPLAENAARHGVYPRSNQGGTVIIRTYQTPRHYVIEVEDDGVGFDAEKVLKQKSDSVGLKNMIFRMKTLMNADVIIESHIDLGTKITVKIPVEQDTKVR